MLAVLSAQRADARQLARTPSGAAGTTKPSHLALIERIDAIIAKTNAA